MTRYDVWAVNGYDDTDMFRIGEHLTMKETIKMVRDPDKFDAMYQPMVFVENTMNEVRLPAEE